jgi:hypothetical protein
MSFFIIIKYTEYTEYFTSDNEFDGNENATHNTVGSKCIVGCIFKVKYFVWGVISNFKVGWMGAVEDGIET